MTTTTVLLLVLGAFAGAAVGRILGLMEERKRHAAYTTMAEAQIRQLDLDRHEANARAETWRKSAGEWRKALLQVSQARTEPVVQSVEEEEHDQPLSVRENDKRVANERRAREDRTAMTTMMPIRTNDPEALPVPHLSIADDANDEE